MTACNQPGPRYCLGLLWLLSACADSPDQYQNRSRGQADSDLLRQQGMAGRYELVNASSLPRSRSQELDIIESQELFLDVDGRFKYRVEGTTLGRNGAHWTREGTGTYKIVDPQELVLHTPDVRNATIARFDIMLGGAELRGCGIPQIKGDNTCTLHIYRRKPREMR